MNRLFFSVAFTALSFNAFAALTAEQQLGETLYKDKNLSFNRNQSCESCHALTPSITSSTNVKGLVPSFADVKNIVDGSAVSAGSISGDTGTLNAPSVAYAAFSPRFRFDAVRNEYVGGQFWNGRATDLIEQAKKPFLNPVEMAMIDELAVVERLRENPQYVEQFQSLYNFNINNSNNTQRTYNALARAIASFESSAIFNKFNSKFDYYLTGKTQLTALEQQGFNLFKGKAKCAACHKIDVVTDANGVARPPMLTTFAYRNNGLPRNVNIPNNPEPDLGLGGRTDIALNSEIGKHKVQTLRNIELTPPYGHNGVFKTLEEVVHFYNTRDVLQRVADNNSPGFGKTGWSAPEVIDNLNTAQVGSLRLNAGEESAVVAFLKTLTDDYPTWGRDTNVPVGTASPFNISPNLAAVPVEPAPVPPAPLQRRIR
jgi:cytochrome c peroxidase